MNKFAVRMVHKLRIGAEKYYCIIEAEDKEDAKEKARLQYPGDWAVNAWPWTLWKERRKHGKA